MAEPDAALDALFARVWATPAGGELLAQLRTDGRRSVALVEIAERVLRARKAWHIRGDAT